MAFRGARRAPCVGSPPDFAHAWHPGCTLAAAQRRLALRCVLMLLLLEQVLLLDVVFIVELGVLPVARMRHFRLSLEKIPGHAHFMHPHPHLVVVMGPPAVPHNLVYKHACTCTHSQARVPHPGPYLAASLSAVCARVLERELTAAPTCCRSSQLAAATQHPQV